MSRDAAACRADLGRRAGETRGCLFCRRGDGGFTSQEHVFSESLGNTELILPPGVVCDPCNNQRLSQPDQTILDFMPVGIRRTMLGIKTKAGKVPRFRFSEGTVEHIPGAAGADPTLVINPQGPKPTLRELERTPDGRVKLEWKSSRGRRMTARYASDLSRALLKSAFECAWIDHKEMMLERRFDHIRDAVLGASREGFFAMGLKLDPDSTRVSLTYNLLPQGDGTWRMPVVADFFGVFVATDSRLAEVDHDLPPDYLSVMPFTASDARVA